MVSDAIVLGGQDSESIEGRHATRFLPFIGISPTRHSDLYSWLPRKDDFGRGTFPPGQATEASEGTALKPNAILRWASTEVYHDDITPVRWTFGEATALLTLKRLGPQAETVLS